MNIVMSSRLYKMRLSPEFQKIYTHMSLEDRGHLTFHLKPKICGAEAPLTTREAQIMHF
jgi:hypothetical protein